MARNPATMRPELDDNIIAGASSPAHLSSGGPSSSIKPVKSDGTSTASIDGSAYAADAIIQEIEPPAFEDILMFKVKEQSRPFFFVEWFTRSQKKKQKKRTTDEESRLLQTDTV